MLATPESVDLGHGYDHAAANEISEHATSLPSERRSAAAHVKAIATKPGQVSTLRIEGVPLDRLSALRKALAGV